MLLFCKMVTNRAAFIIGLTLLSLTEQLAEASSSCPNDLPHTTAVLKHHNKCYQFVYVEKYWTEARDYCRLYNGRLLKIDDADTNQFIVSTLNALSWGNNGVWIGLHDTVKELRWKWDSGRGLNEDEFMEWTNWGKGHPAAKLHTFRDCVRMVRGEGDWKWHETPCHFMKWHYRFICQYNVNNSETSMRTPASNYRLRDGHIKSKHWTMDGRDITSSPNNIISSHHDYVAEEHEELLHDGAQGLQAESRENVNKSSAGTAAIVSISILAVAILLLILFLLRRRRYLIAKQSEQDDDIYADIGDEKDGKEVSDIEKKKGTSGYLKREKEIWVTLLSDLIPGRSDTVKTTAVQNTYVDMPTATKSLLRAAPAAAIAADTGADSKSLYLPMSGATYAKINDVESSGECKKAGNEEYVGGDRKVGIVYENGKSDQTEYDEPRKPNVYSEIPDKMMIRDDDDDDDNDDNADHVYESLDDVKKKTEAMKRASDSLV